MKVILVGGHLSPLLAVIDELQAQKNKKIDILVIGKKYTFEGDKTLSLEYQTVSKMGIPFISILTGRMQRKWTRYTLLSIFKIPYGLFQAFLILKKHNPDIVLSFGSYISLPVAIASLILHIPIVIHEQTLEAGLANKIISVFAKKVCISWESSRKFFPNNKTVLTGNPIRKEILKLNFSNHAINNPPFIYVTGGSAGSHQMNFLIEGCIEKLLKKYVVFHQTGDTKQYKDYERLQTIKEKLENKLKARFFLEKFVEPSQVGEIMQKADLIISRSGINTVTELLFLGKPSLLIPLPYSQNKEQIKNASLLEKLGLGKMLDQEKLTAEKLFQIITLTIENLTAHKKPSEDTQKIIVKNAAGKIVEILCSEIQF